MFYFPLSVVLSDSVLFILLPGIILYILYLWSTDTNIDMDIRHGTNTGFNLKNSSNWSVSVGVRHFNRSVGATEYYTIYCLLFTKWKCFTLWSSCGTLLRKIIMISYLVKDFFKISIINPVIRNMNIHILSL